MKYSKLCYCNCHLEDLPYEDACMLCKQEYEEHVIVEHENRYREITESEI
jgi:hypothetical protein